MEYDPEKEKEKVRLRKWGMCDKEPYDVTINDTLSDLQAILKAHKDTIKGVIIIPVYDHLDMQELAKKYPDAEDENKPPSHSYLCSGGVPLLEAVGHIEHVKYKILS